VYGGTVPAELGAWTPSTLEAYLDYLGVEIGGAGPHRSVKRIALEPEQCDEHGGADHAPGGCRRPARRDRRRGEPVPGSGSAARLRVGWIDGVPGAAVRGRVAPGHGTDGSCDPGSA